MLVEQIGTAPVNIVIDAFDECKCQVRLLEVLRNLMERCDARIFITTRPNVVHLIGRQDLRIDTKSPKEDLRKFVVQQIFNPKEDRLRYLPSLMKKGPPVNGQPFSDYVVEKIVDKSSGMSVILFCILIPAQSSPECSLRNSTFKVFRDLGM